MRALPWVYAHGRDEPVRSPPENLPARCEKRVSHPPYGRAAPVARLARIGRGLPASAVLSPASQLRRRAATLPTDSRCFPPTPTLFRIVCADHPARTEPP